MWKKLSTKIIFKHSRITIVEDKVELPDGSTTDYIRFQSKGDAATIIYKNQDGQYLLQKDYSYPPNEVLIQFPGGVIDENENKKAGAEREFAEETGFKPKKLKLLGKYLLTNRRSDALMYVYEARGITKGKRKLDKEEYGLENIWLTEKEFNNLLSQGKIKNRNTLASWAIYKQSRSRRHL
jgi:ADP-ribose pyrophosphatase